MFWIVVRVLLYDCQVVLSVFSMVLHYVDAIIFWIIAKVLLCDFQGVLSVFLTCCHNM